MVFGSGRMKLALGRFVWGGVRIREFGMKGVNLGSKDIGVRWLSFGFVLVFLIKILRFIDLSLIFCLYM